MRWCVVLFLVASTVGCDAVTKRLAAENLAGFPTRSFFGDTVRLSYAENAGGFLNLGAAHTIALSLFLAGGFSNWFDRLNDGRVIDFLNVGIGGLRTGIFNVADVAIMVGAALFLIAESRASRGDNGGRARSRSRLRR